MKRMIFSMLTLLILSTASMNAQVRIGGTADPNQSTVLDLNATDVASGNLGLALPRVVLTSATALLNDAVPPNGTVVYNTGGNLNEGIYYWTGGQWVYISGFVPKITTQPTRFIFGRLKDADGDPYAPDFTEKTLTVVASGPGLSYQWYQKAKNPNAPDIELTDATTSTYTFSAPAVGVANWGLYQYYCVVSNIYGSVKSDLAEIAVGCGAKTATGGWLKFMCYNLGGKRGDDPFVFTAGDSTNLGKFYQWGRPDSIARTATAPDNFIKTTAYPGDWKIPAGYATPLDDSYHQDDDLWRNHKNGTQDPCPAGWHVPSQSAFSSIFKGTADADVYGNATANTWTPTSIETWSWTSVSSYGNGGYAVKPDGITTTLFLPAAGYIGGNNGHFTAAGNWAFYWSGTSASKQAFRMGFDRGKVYPAIPFARGHGASVRCVSES